MRVLIVEDDPWAAVAAGAVLAQAGHEIVGIAEKGRDAITRLEAGPELVLTDLYLADQTGGVEVARAARTTCGAPTLFLTSDPALARKGSEWALGSLRKPFGPSDLLEAVAVCESLIKGRGSRDGAAEGRLELYDDTADGGRGGRAGT